MEKRSLRIVFYASNFTGPQNACIGFGQTLAERGHDVYFFSTKEWLRKYQKFGFKCLLLNDEDEAIETAESPEDSIRKYVDELNASGFLEDKSPLEKLRQLQKLRFLEEHFGEPARRYDSKIKDYLKNEPKFDLIIIDSEIYPPSLVAANRPWIYLFCSNPIGLFQSDELPPFTSDFSTNSNPELWKEFQQELNENFYKNVRDEQMKIFSECGVEFPRESADRYVQLSPYLNLYQFPREIDYHDTITIDPKKFFGVDAFCRFELNYDDGSLFEIPFRNRMKKDDKLIYLSLGSMGSGNIELMKRLIRIFARTKHWFIVSKGKLSDQYAIEADNVWGDKFLPQTHVLSMVDAAILHGGNNGFTEALYFGRPLIIMPMFYDQYHNAKRVVEKRIGFELNPFNFNDEQLLFQLDQIVYNQELRKRCESIGKNIRQRQLKHKASELLEKIVEEFDSIEK